MLLPAHQQVRLCHQLDAARRLLADLDAAALETRSPEGGWSVRDHLAHLGRYHEVFRMPLERIVPRWVEFLLLHEAHHLYAILWHPAARR